MTLARPAYTITVRNVSRGWVLTTTHREEPQTEPLAPVILRDGMTHTWGFEDDRVPNRFEPARVTFTVSALTRADLPDVRTGDVFTVSCDRPLDGWPANPAAVATYFTIDGRLSDPELTLDPQASNYRATLSLTVTDFLADLNQRYPAIDERTAIPPFLITRLTHVAQRARVNIVVPGATSYLGDHDYAWVDIGGSSTFTDADVHTLWASASNTSPTEYTPGERVVCYPRAFLNDDPPIPSESVDWFEYVNDTESGIKFWLTPILRRLPPAATIYTLTAAAGQLAATLDDAAARTRAGLAYLDGAHVRTPLSARLSRENAVDTIVVNGWQLTSDYQVTETTRSRSRQTDAEFGTVTRSVGTQAEFYTAHLDFSGDYMADRIAAAFMPDGSADDQPWGYDSLDVCTWLMDDADLDRLAPLFWPAYPRADTPEPRTLTQLIVNDVDASVADNAGSGQLRAIVAGAKHTISRGRLLIQPRLIGGVLPPDPNGTDAVTAADLIAAGGTYAAAGADDIDPTLTAADFRLIGL